MSEVVEIARYRLRENITAKNYIKSAQSYVNWLKQQPGFHYISIVQAEDGEIMDIMYWDSQENASAAMSKFTEAPGASEATQMIDHESFQMSFFDLRLKEGG